ncbi:MAG: hypothetical protein IJ329_00060 [Clostridia bacterium]|nr:hypothetical protein [Clostridia bacterium]
MKKSAFISDLIFTFFLTGVFFLCLFRYLGSSMVLALLFAALCGCIAVIGVGILGQNKRKRLRLKHSEETQKEKLLAHLSLLSDAQKTSFFQVVLSHSSPVQRFSSLRLTGEKELYFLRIRFSPVTADEIASISRVKTSKEKILLCNCIEEEAKALCETLNIRIWTGNEVYAHVKEADALPQKYLGEPTPKDKRKLRLRLCFAKSNSRRFLVGGCLILLTSLITPFPYYYLIFGSALLIVALFIRIFGYTG